MDKNEAISAARDVIGKGEENDYRLSPVSHSEEYKEKAPELAKILCNTGILETAKEYVQGGRVGSGRAKEV